MSKVRLGNISEAAETLGVDLADVIEMRAAGYLTFTRDSDDACWIVWAEA
jgi:hypothetical protein